MDANVFIRETDGVKVTVREQNDGTVYLSIETGRDEITYFDYKNGRNLLKIADAIMTWQADDELKHAQEQEAREYFSTLCGDCLIPLNTCAHAGVVA